MYWMLHLYYRWGGLRMHEFHMCSTPYSFYLMHFWGGLYIRLLPARFSVIVLGTLEDTMIPYVFNSVFLLIYRVTIII